MNYGLLMGHDKHPSKPDLLLYAEILVDGRVAIPAQTAAHVAECHACRREVEAIARTLEFVEEAPALDPSREFAARILLAAKTERHAVESQLRRRRTVLRAGKMCAAAASVLLLVNIAHTPVMTIPPAGQTADTQPIAAAHAPEPVPNAPLESSLHASIRAAESMGAELSMAALETSRETLEQEKLLRTVVMAPRRGAQSIHEQRIHRTLETLDADINAAIEARELNPALVRADEVVSSSRQRLQEELKAAYVERPL